MRIWEEKNPDTQDAIAIKTFIATFAQARTIWMDGRPHPSEYAAHTWQGFSTGKWEGGATNRGSAQSSGQWVSRVTGRLPALAPVR